MPWPIPSTKPYNQHTMKTLYATFIVGALLAQSASAQFKLAQPHPADGTPVRFHQDAHSTAALRGGAPANDECASAEALTVNAECVNTPGNNAAATHDGADPACDETTDAFLDVWYSFNSGSNTQITVTLTVGTIEDVGIELLDGGCGAASLACDFSALTYTWDVAASTDYVFRVYSNTQYGNGGEFEICLTAGAGPEPPANDECAGATPQDLSVGSTITFSGTTVGATDSEGFGFNTAWESFTITECANVSVDYCGSDPVYQGWVAGLVLDCPVATFLDTNSIAIGECTDGNAGVLYSGLEPGTYYFVQAAGGSVAPGPYTANVTAVSCIIGIEENAAAAWSLFPNPGTGVFNLQYNGKNGLANVEVMDVIGRIVYNQQAQVANGTTQSLDLTGLSAGNYNVRLTVGGARTEQRLMVK